MAHLRAGTHAHPPLPPVHIILSKLHQPVSWSQDYRKSLKSMDTEEHIDLAFYRPIGYMWARLAARLGVTPNAITIASIFLGVAAGILFYYPELWINVIGMLLLIWANTFDSADGQLARLTHQYSRLGRILDGLSGDFWFLTIYIAIVLRENQTVPLFISHHWILWTIAALAG
ncbi:MAG: CDP-alcohol phosphatidyltransferase family protein, partial [Duncaniella sp.]|nr:CDP-alcohol phosphatidyltransferase family protein [Duncaniella sp.]